MNRTRARLGVSLGLGAALLACDSAVTAPAGGGPPAASGYRQTNLVADLPGIAGRNDPNFRNPWGLAFAPGAPFWISNNQLGTARVFGPAGNPENPVGVVVPPPTGSRLRSTPTGIAFNPIAGDFHASGRPAQFLFATEDGTISTWATINGNVPSAGVLAVDRSADGAVFTGLAILTPACCREFLAVTDFHGGSIATFTVSFDRLATSGNFTDPQLPAGYAPFNIQPIGGQVFVTYALRDAAGREPVAGPGNGIVDIFAQDGTFLRRFASNGVLNAPWGVVQASQDFGPFSHAILIGNFGDGTVNAFDATSGASLGTLEDGSGQAVTNPGLWALAFRSDGVGSPNVLYFTAGPGAGQHGLFGAISYSSE